MVEVSKKPNRLNTFRYDVRVGKRTTHGFRQDVKRANEAAREDEALLYTCASMERAQREAEEAKD